MFSGWSQRLLFAVYLEDLVFTSVACECLLWVLGTYAPFPVQVRRDPSNWLLKEGEKPFSCQIFSDSLGFYIAQAFSSEKNLYIFKKLGLGPILIWVLSKELVWGKWSNESDKCVYLCNVLFLLATFSFKKLPFWFPWCLVFLYSIWHATEKLLYFTYSYNNI